MIRKAETKSNLRETDRGKTSSGGLILLHKQPGLTSFDSLRNIKRLLGSGKVGHTGTLDKFAEGLLLVLTGRALKVSQWFTHCDKQYEGTICFGVETDTLDPEGSPVAHAPLPSREAVEQALSLFHGSIEQIPPAYSAIHVDGERASALARRGETPEMRKRQVHIHRLELLSWNPPEARILAHCTSGTYIRSLARDIAVAAGSRAHLSALVRTCVAGFKLEDAVSLEDGEQGSAISETQLPNLHPIDKTVFTALGVSCMDISSHDAKKIIQGKPLMHIFRHAQVLPEKSGDTVALFSDNAFIAIIERARNESRLSPFPVKWNYGYVYARD